MEESKMESQRRCHLRKLNVHELHLRRQEGYWQCVLPTSAIWQISPVITFSKRSWQVRLARAVVGKLRDKLCYHSPFNCLVSMYSQ